MRIGSMDLNKQRGLGDKVIGLNKEVIGTLVNNDRLQEAGEAQQAKGSEALKALKKEAEAEARERKADTFEQRQKLAQRSKESA